eukprot:355887-Chlamydomonas_euryale.AAC.2
MSEPTLRCASPWRHVYAIAGSKTAHGTHAHKSGPWSSGRSRGKRRVCWACGEFAPFAYGAAACAASIRSPSSFSWPVRAASVRVPDS